MPGSPIDFIGSMLGRPDPMQQLAAALGQAPGQPGSPAGPQPLAGAAVAPAAAAGPPGGSGGPPQAPPQPQAYQSPPDLAQAYMALMQRDQASNDFYNGAALLSAGMFPGRNPGASMKWAAAHQQDAGSTMSDLVKIQQIGQQNQALQAFQRSIPDYAAKTGMTEDQVRAIGPQGMGEVMTKIAEANAGVGGGAAWMAQQRAEKALIAAGKPIPWIGGDPASFSAWQAADITEKKQATTDIGNAKDSFATMNSNYTNLRDNMAWIKAHPDAVVEALTTMSPTGGVMGKGAGALGTVSQDALTASQKLAFLNTQLYASNFRGTKQRLSQAEAQRLGDQFTMLNKNAFNMSPEDIKTEIGRLADQIDTGHANVITAAGQELPADLDGKADRIYTDKDSSLYAYGTGPVKVAKAKDVPEPNASASSSPAPPVPGAKQAPDGHWYVPDSSRPGKYLRVD